MAYLEEQGGKIVHLLLVIVAILIYLELNLSNWTPYICIPERK